MLEFLSINTIIKLNANYLNFVHRLVHLDINTDALYLINSLICTSPLGSVGVCQIEKLTDWATDFGRGTDNTRYSLTR